jgi:hypothetical protein
MDAAAASHNVSPCVSDRPRDRAARDRRRPAADVGAPPLLARCAGGRPGAFPICRGWMRSWLPCAWITSIGGRSGARRTTPRHPGGTAPAQPDNVIEMGQVMRVLIGQGDRHARRARRQRFPLGARRTLGFRIDGSRSVLRRRRRSVRQHGRDREQRTDLALLPISGSGSRLRPVTCLRSPPPKRPAAAPADRGSDPWGTFAPLRRAGSAGPSDLPSREFARHAAESPPARSSCCSLVRRSSCDAVRGRPSAGRIVRRWPRSSDDESMHERGRVAGRLR